tara:strand:- start:418 stop:606 length:189 start_codon:yes stop_codon:yes gene_type:complete
MLRIGWEPPEVPEYDPEVHNPEKVFAFLCYRGVYYAKWVYLNIFPSDNWNINNPRKDDKRPS